MIAAGLRSDPIGVRTNEADWQWVSPTPAGTRIIEVAEGERIEVQLPTGTDARYAGAQVVNGQWRALPIGSSLDAQAGVFYWQPGAGFLGRYDLVFAPSKGSGAAVQVGVVVGPSMRATIDMPQAEAAVQLPFTVAGWALDLAATDGAGIDTVHVWAYPVAEAHPTLREPQGRPEPRRRAIFLGVAASGDARPDVGAIYGRAFERSAYSLTVDQLPPGTYDVVVYPHRARTDSFEGAQVVRVIVR